MLLNAGADPFGLTATERTILETLWRVSTTGPAAADDILTELYFSGPLRRALILQRRGRFGYYYVEPETYDDPFSRDAAVQSFVELLMFFIALRQRGLVAFYEPAGRDAEQMVYIGPVFEKPKVAIGRYVLNSQGDYSEDPATIQSQDGTVIFKGIRLTEDLFDIADRCSRGLLYASPAIGSLFSSNSRPAFEQPQAGPAVAVSVPPAPSGTEECDGPQPSAPDPAVSPEAPAPEPGQPEAVPEAPLTREQTRAARLAALVEEEKRKTASARSRPASGMPSILTDPEPAAAPPAGPRPPVRRGFSVSETSFITLIGLAGALLALLAFAAGWLIGEQRRRPQAAAAKPSAAPVKPASFRGRFHGLDVSRWNGDWLTHLRSPVSSVAFVFVRATNGLATDPMYEKNWNALREQDIIRGTYHFFRYDQDARAQARHYAQVIGENEHREITPAVDFEELSLSGATPPSVEALQDRLLLMLRTLEEANGRTPMIYTDFSMAEKWLGHPEFARYGLWLADWTTRPAPRVPATWRKAGYKLWQRSSTYTIPDNGRSPLDLDLYDGLLEDLYR